MTGLCSGRVRFDQRKDSGDTGTRQLTSMLPAPRPLRGRSVQHGPHPFLALEQGGAYSRTGCSWRSGGGPRRQHLNVM